MTSAKAQRYLDLLQAALDGQDYAGVPELCRKVRKHAPDQAAYSDAAEAEALLLDAVRKQGYCGRKPTGEYFFYWPSIEPATAARVETLLKHEGSLYVNSVRLVAAVTRRDVLAARQAAQASPIAKDVRYAVSLGVAAELQNQSDEAVIIYRSCPPVADNAASRWWQSILLYRLAILTGDAAAFSHFERNDDGSLARLHVLSTQPGNKEFTKALLRSSKFPPASSNSMPLLQGVQQSYDRWLQEGCPLADAESLIAIVQGAVEKSYHSPRLLRMLAHLQNDLERYQASDLALKAYVQVAIHARKTQKDNPDCDPIATILHTLAAHLQRIARRDRGFERHNIVTLDMIESWRSTLANDLGELDSAAQRNASYLASAVQYHKAWLYDWSRAVDLASQYLAEQETGEALYKRAILQSIQLESSTALATLRSCLHIEPTLLKAYLCLANVFFLEEDYKRALTVLTKVTEASSTVHGFEKQRLVFLALKMEVQVIERSQGARAALKASAAVFQSFALLFGDVEKAEKAEITTPQTLPQLPSPVALLADSTDAAAQDPPAMSLDGALSSSTRREKVVRLVSTNGTVTTPANGHAEAATSELPSITEKESAPTMPTAPVSSITEQSDVLPPLVSGVLATSAPADSVKNGVAAPVAMPTIQEPTPVAAARMPPPALTTNPASPSPNLSITSSRERGRRDFSAPHSLLLLPMDRYRDTTGSRSLAGSNGDGGHHVLRKSASMRSFRQKPLGRTPSIAKPDATPIVPVKAAAFLPETSTKDPAVQHIIDRLAAIKVAWPRHDERREAAQIDLARRRALLADLWLYVADLSRRVLESGAGGDADDDEAATLLDADDEDEAAKPQFQFEEAQRAVEEARKLTGYTTATLIASARNRIALFDRVHHDELRAAAAVSVSASAGQRTSSALGEESETEAEDFDAGLQPIPAYLRSDVQLQQALIECETAISLSEFDDAHAAATYAALLLRLADSPQDERTARAYAILESAVAGGVDEEYIPIARQKQLVEEHANGDAAGDGSGRPMSASSIGSASSAGTTSTSGNGGSGGGGGGGGAGGKGQRGNMVIGGPAQRHAEAVYLYAEVARRRGETARAEAAFWKAVDLADQAGLLPWHELWLL